MRKYRRTTLIAVGCLAALAGIGLARRFSFQPQIWWLAFSPFLLILRKRKLASLYLAVILGLGLGLWRGSVYMQQLNVLHSYSGQTVMVQGTVQSDSIYGKSSQMEFVLGNARLMEPDNRQLAGKFRVSGFGIHMAYRGDKVQVSGKLYPSRGSTQARISYAQMQTIGQDSGWLNNWTRRFSAGVQNALPEPLASFALGLLIGQRNTLPQIITAQLTMVGLVHIVAVSGYNLTIIVRVIQRVGLRSKYQRLMLSLGLIVAFVLVTGFSASIVRAAVISILSLWAWYYGLKIRPVVLIAFAAALTGLFNPFYVWGDLAWYLSFLAFFGILVIAPILSARIFKKQPKLLTQVVIETMSAEIMTLPLIMMSFSQLSLIALLANALVVPLVPLAMLLSAIAGTAGALVPTIAGWLAWPARLLLTYMLDIVHLMANIPSIFLHLNLSPALMVISYCFILLIIFSMRRHLKTKIAAPAMQE